MNHQRCLYLISDKLTGTESTETMNIKRKKVLLLYGFMAVLSCLYLYDNFPWLWRVALYQVSGFKPASAYHVFEFEKQTHENLIVEFINLNDRKWYVRTARKKHIGDRLGAFYTYEQYFSPGEKKVIAMPSFKSRGMGLIAITGRTDWKTLPSQPAQKFFMRVIPAHNLSGKHPDYGVPDDGYPVITIYSDDLESIYPDTMLKMEIKDIQLIP